MEPDARVRAYVEEVFSLFPIVPETAEWLRQKVRFEVEDLGSTRGGGYWYPGEEKVFLFTAQYEAALHEMAHAWWHYRREPLARELMEAVVRLSEEPDPAYAPMRALAYGYVHGIPEQNWAGMLVEENDWEMFAGLASGCMADVRMLPPYVRRFYDGLFALLPPDARAPVDLAPHR